MLGGEGGHICKLCVEVGERIKSENKVIISGHSIGSAVAQHMCAVLCWDRHSDFGQSGVRALPLAAGRNEGVNSF
jgi:hypothetical protein